MISQMRKLIIERLKALQREKQELKKIPANPNEMELRKDISDILDKELDALIEEGSITVTGVTINKYRILSM